MKITGRVLLDTTPTFKVGDPCPDGYIARQEWAEVHMKAGLKQVECCRCMVWMFPHELSETRTYSTAWTSRNGGEKVTFEHRICLKCEQKKKTK